jgi:hypothetical protein
MRTAMYEHLRTSVTAVAIACGLAACAGPKPGAGYTDAVPGELRELIEEKHSQGLYAVGSAVASKEGLAVRLAAARARAELAREFTARIDALQKSYQLQVNDQDNDEYQETIEILTSLELSGSTIVKSMVRPARDHSYDAKVLVVVSAEQLKKVIDREMHAYTSFRASKAYKELEERVRRERELRR